MEALLGGLGLGIGASNSGFNGNSCGFVADLQDRLRSLFVTHVAESRADHISATFELRSTTVFFVPSVEPENDAGENGATADSLLGGARASVAPNTPGLGSQSTRQITAIDTLINQPSDNHALQMSVAKHITASLAEVDSSSWTVRQVSRGEQGWTFTYICKDSWQAWSRQTSKNPAKSVIGEWSNKDGPDSINMSRPAFDCRGSLTIAFVKSSRSIQVKYDHTPIHKTVAQLAEIVIPPPPAPVPRTPAAPRRAPKPPKEPKQPKPPKEPKAPKEPRTRIPKTPGTARRRKRQTEEGAPDGEGSKPKKRRKKEPDAAGQGANVHPPEMPGALPVGQASQRPLYNSNGQESEDPDGGQQNSYSSYPEGLVGSSAANGATSRSDSGAVSVNGGVHSHSILNLPEGEAARRREVAIKLLSDQDVDPSTLSPEQFSIFANQSPDLQKESLAMLVRYGAERLRIVHPTKDATSSGQSTPSQAGDQAMASPVSAKGASPSPASASKPKRSRKKKSDVPSAAPEESIEAVAPPATAGNREQKPTRGSCESCRDSKTKCDKRKPSCSQCLGSGASCYYPLAKPRPSRVSKAELEHETPEPVAVEEEEEPDDLGSPGFGNEPETLPPPPAPVSPPIQEHHSFSQPSNLYEQSASLNFPHTGNNTALEPPQASISPAAMEYMPTSNTSMRDYTYSHPPPPPPPPPPQPPPQPQPQPSPVAVPEQHHTPPVQQNPQTNFGAPRTRSRRSLPSAQPAHNNTSNESSTGAQDSWQQQQQHQQQQTAPQPMPQPMAQPIPPPAPAPAPVSKPSPRSSRAKRPAQASVPLAYDDLRQTPSWPAPALSTPQPATQSAAQASNQPAQTSPYLANARTTRTSSRQSNRAQTRTPVQNVSTTTLSQPPAQHTLAENTGYPSNAGVTDSNSASSYNTYTQYPAARAETSSTNRVAYDQYTNNNQPSAVSSSYSSYDNYNARPNNTSSSTTLSNPVSQTAAAPYSTSTTAAPSASQWGATSSGSSRNTQSYNTNQSASTTRPYNVAASNTQQSQTLQGFNVRPPPPPTVQTRSSTSAYNHQQHQQQQPAPPAQPQSQVHTRSQSQQQRHDYNSYSNQPQQQQPQHNNNSSSSNHSNNQNWFGFSGASNSTPSSYSSTSASANTAYPNSGSHAHGSAAASYSQAQTSHHRSMNLSGHTYSSIDGGDQALYDLLRTNPAG
ncbi:hypothetical protein B0T19DRAFT_204987 [Cercophora scortea]|uniref:Zn(2)-C6 fungal-type domain-containing protein n=1 Tax=Cercophora scortea TaxID=314031 RepID=A0AAE0IE71_9PEZI|nr:hypothetical protein B0T19DRAFT_204987 [Cercophora scortea]